MLTASTLAYMSAKNGVWVQPATFFTTMVDFTYPGELGGFFEEAQLQKFGDYLDKVGYLNRN